MSDDDAPWWAIMGFLLIILLSGMGFIYSYSDNSRGRELVAICLQKNVANQCAWLDHDVAFCKDRK